MLLGIDLQFYDIGAIDEGDFYIKFHLCNKVDNYKWALAFVYETSAKKGFFAKLVNTYSHENLLLLIGSDYNILRHLSEKTMIATMSVGHSYSTPL
jgi:hypothetical protein